MPCIALAFGVPAMPAHAEQRPGGTVAQDALEAQFRGCETTGWCRFAIDTASGSDTWMYRVYPEGLTHMQADEPLSRAVRDRLNALLSSMIHQHKRVELHGLRGREDGTYVARVTVNGADVASDPIFAELGVRAPAPQR